MRIIFIFILSFFINSVVAQEHAWVYFTDKPDQATAMANPLSMLTQRALDRRVTQNIALDYKDVPIHNTYINQVIAQNGIIVSAKSKWLNAVHVFGLEADINALLTLLFVDSIEFADSSLNARFSDSVNTEQSNTKFDVATTYNYGGSFNQSNQIRANYLHEQNFTGATMQIAVLDAGFPGVDTFGAFQQIRDNNQILGGYDFVARSPNFYQGNRHGTSVLSTIAGFIDGALAGTALDAEFYLFRTEDAAPETPLEESLWVEAAEMADSLGVDIINTSLGYQDFDESKYDHLYSDMDGQTTFISRGANVAAERGILVIAAAGNDGTHAYNNISSPADATNVFTVGAVDSNGVIANFSSFGPSFDNRIKPDVCAKGFHATVIDVNGNVTTGSGTSYATPILAGAMACLWQAYPNKTNFEIMQMVRESAHLFNNPTNQEGYGIPNLENTFLAASVPEISLSEITVYPNPTTTKIQFNFNDDLAKIKVVIFDALGKKLRSTEINKWNNSIDVSDFKKGLYLLQLDNGKKMDIIKIVKN